MDREFSAVLEDCLHKLGEGSTLETCLQLHPQQAEKLRPLLQAALLLRAAPTIQPTPEALQASRKRMLLSLQRQESNRRPGRLDWKLAFSLAMCLIVVVLVGGLITVNASAHSLPGDKLYGVKLGWEAVRLEMALTTQSRKAIETQITRARVEEIHQLIQANRQGIVNLEGVLEDIQENNWSVNGITVLIGPQTVIEGASTTGSRLSMQVQVREDGQVVALNVNFYPLDKTTSDSSGDESNSSTQDTSSARATPEANRTATPTPTTLATDDDEQESTEEYESTDEPKPTESGEPDD